MKRLSLLLAAAVVFGTLVASGGPAGAAITSISARAAVTEIDFGRSTNVVGNVSPRQRGVTVVLERGFTSSWSARGTAVTDANGNFSISIKPSQKGIYKFRMRSGSVVSPTFYLRVWNVTYLDTLDEVYSGFSSGARYINGTLYNRALYRSASCGSWSRVEYNLGRSYRKLTSVIGVDDQSSTSTIRYAYQVIVDGSVRASGSVRLGVQTAISVDVTDDLRMTLQFQEISGYCGSGYIGFGNPALRS